MACSNGYIARSIYHSNHKAVIKNERSEVGTVVAFAPGSSPIAVNFLGRGGFS
jgi:hypothetical protein